MNHGIIQIVQGMYTSDDRNTRLAGLCLQALDTKLVPAQAAQDRLESRAIETRLQVTTSYDMSAGEYYAGRFVEPAQQTGTNPESFDTLWLNLLLRAQTTPLSLRCRCAITTLLDCESGFFCIFRYIL